jgi:Bacteriophage HK97-gp10, putative tail-component
VDVSELGTFLERMEDAVRARAAAAASDAMAVTYRDELVNVTLRTSSHPKGTVTPAKPGEPPSLITGTLRRSAQVVNASAGSEKATADVKMGTVYARIQEKGGVIRAKRAPYLRFEYPAGSWHRVKKVTIPARPYIGPTLFRLKMYGKLNRAGAAAARKVAQEAAGG